MVGLRLFCGATQIRTEPMEPILHHFRRRPNGLLLLLLLVFLVMAFSVLYRAGAAEDDDYVEPRLDMAEEEAVYGVLEAANSEINWRKMFPGDLCMGAPHGIVCDFDEGDRRWHIVELNIGWVSDSSDYPACGPNATFSPSMAAFPRLRKVFFYRCFLHGTVAVPSYLWTLGGGGLREVAFLENPALGGPLPTELGGLSGLTQLVFQGTALGGAIPAQIGGLRLLRRLVLSGSSLVGGVPAAIGGLERLVVLDLSGNRLRGALPRELGGLVTLAKLDLSFNRLDGSLPLGLANLRALELMDLSYNEFSGGIPSFVAGLGALRYLSLSGNPIGGPMPDFWDKMGGLLSLGLSGASLTGAIPGSVGGLRSIRYLALDGNRLAGGIPTQLGELPYVHYLNLSGNSLTGSVPFSPEFVNRLGGNLRLSGNSGLCFDPETVARHSPMISTKPCSDSPRRASPAFHRSPAGVDSAGATRNNGANGSSSMLLMLALFLLWA